MIRTTVVLVYFAMPPQVGDNREVASAALDFASECCKMSVKFSQRLLRKTYASRQYGCTYVSGANWGG
jgi:hypothetical protein